MKKKIKKGIKAKPWKIFSYYIMPFILGIITFFGFSKIYASVLNNKLYILPNIVSELNKQSLFSLFLSLVFIALGYFLYWGIYSEVDTNKINFNMITSKSIIIPLLAVIMFYFSPNIWVFLHDIASILIHDEKFKYTYLLIHVLWTYSIFGLIYYKDKDIVKIMKIHYSFVLSIFIPIIITFAIVSNEHFITVILEHRLRTITVFWFAFILPFLAYCSTERISEVKYKDFLFNNDVSYKLLLIEGIFVIVSIIYYYLVDILAKGVDNLVKALYNLVIKLNSISYIPAMLTTLTVIFIGLAIYKTRKQLLKK